MLLELSSSEIKKIITKKENKSVIMDLISPTDDDKLDIEKAKLLLKSIIKYVGDFDLERKEVDSKNTIDEEDVFHLIGYPNNLNYNFLIGRVKPRFNNNVGINIDHQCLFKQGLLVTLPPEAIVNNEEVTSYGINQDFIVLHLHDHLRNNRNETFLVLRRKDFLEKKDSFKLSCDYDIVNFKSTLSYNVS